MESGEISKGGEVLFELTIDRKGTNMEVWFRSAIQLEDFIQSLCVDQEGLATIPTKLDTYSKAWTPLSPEQGVYTLAKDIDTAHYTLNALGSSLVPYGKAGNISFLRFIGMSKPEGVGFQVPGPISRDFMRNFKEATLDTVRQLLRDYVLPVHINLRLTSTEL